MKSDRRVSASEWEVMKVVWKYQTCSAQQVIDDISGATGWSATTVKTLVNRLLRKGALTFARNGKSYLYSPAWTEDQCRHQEAESFLDRVFDGSLSPMVAHFIRSRKLSAKDLEELRRLLKEK